MEGDFWFKTLFSARCVEGTLGSGERLLAQTGFLVQGLLRGVWHLRWDAPEHPPDVPSKATRSLSESLLALAKEELWWHPTFSLPLGFVVHHSFMDSARVQSIAPTFSTCNAARTVCHRSNRSKISASAVSSS